MGSLIFWRFFLGIGCGGIYPLTATIMAEYSSKFSRGTYLSLVLASQGSFEVVPKKSYSDKKFHDMLCG